MTATDTRNEPGQRATQGRRALGPVGTAARAVLGSVLLGSVIWGERRDALPAGLVLGLMGFPVLMLAWQWLRASHQPARLRATGPAGTAVNCVAGLVVYLIGWYVPALWFTSDALLAFYGASMLLAALRGYAGCEVLAVSNWVLGRDDQVGCVVLSPIDHLEGRGRRPSSGRS